MEIQIRVPEAGESVHEAMLTEWYKRDGDFVRKGDILFAVETDKVTLEVSAEADGVLKILIRGGATVAVGSVVGIIETAAQPGEQPPARPPSEAPRPAKPSEETPDLIVPFTLEEPTAMAEATSPGTPSEPGPGFGRDRSMPVDLSPSAARLASEKRIDSAGIAGSGPAGRITRGDVLLFIEEAAEAEASGRKEGGGRPPAGASPRKTSAEEPFVPPKSTIQAAGEKPGPSATVQEVEETVRRRPMSRIRQRIAERLLEARRNTAMLTTFNEIDMSRVRDARLRFKEAFVRKYGVSLGIMSFFVKASVAALKEFPEVNAFIDGRDIVYHDYYHIGIAVGAERGLVVPVIRHADRLGFAEIEKTIRQYAAKIEKNLLELSDLEGGTFTITNGGVYGSLLSTPILNTPQSGILGMHKIEDRPVVVDGKVAVRPMMYVALSYDHRVIDGREAVGFLKRIKEYVENPERILMEI